MNELYNVYRWACKMEDEDIAPNTYCTADPFSRYGQKVVPVHYLYWNIVYWRNILFIPTGSAVSRYRYIFSQDHRLPFLVVIFIYITYLCMIGTFHNNGDPPEESPKSEHPKLIIKKMTERAEGA